MTITKRGLLLLLVLCGACATRLSAVRPLSAESAAELQQNLENVRATVEVKKQAPVALTRIKLSSEVLEGVGSAGPRSIPVQDLRSITWRARGAGFGRGALAGILLGPLLGGVIGSMIPPSNRDQDTIVNTSQGVFIGLFAGPLVFGIIGELIGVENRIDF